MTNEPGSIDMKDVWQSHTPETLRMSTAELRQKSQRLRKKVFRRNLREDLAAAIVVAFFGYCFWSFHTLLLRLGPSLIIAGIVYVVYQLHARGSARVMPPELAFHTCLEFHRKELERQRDLVRSVWSWYLAPLVLGVIVFILGGAIAQAAANPGHVGHAVVMFSLRMAFVLALFFGTWKLNQRAARRLQLSIDTLIALEKESEE